MSWRIAPWSARLREEFVWGEALTVLQALNFYTGREVVLSPLLVMLLFERVIPSDRHLSRGTETNTTQGQRNNPERYFWSQTPLGNGFHLGSQSPIGLSTCQDHTLVFHMVVGWHMSHWRCFNLVVLTICIGYIWNRRDPSSWCYDA